MSCSEQTAGGVQVRQYHKYHTYHKYRRRTETNSSSTHRHFSTAAAAAAADDVLMPYEYVAPPMTRIWLRAYSRTERDSFKDLTSYAWREQWRIYSVVVGCTRIEIGGPNMRRTSGLQLHHRACACVYIMRRTCWCFINSFRITIRFATAVLWCLTLRFYVEQDLRFRFWFRFTIEAK